tara:strand:- start:131 stop:1177 length:1047 start_codon:yes stop_codon:yes gene_type:complete
MKLLVSRRGIPLPKLFFVSKRSEIKEIPHGVPYIFGDEYTADSIVRIMEYEVLYQRALATGYPFDFRNILKENGFTDISSMSSGDGSCLATRINLEGNSQFDGLLEGELQEVELSEAVGEFKKFMKDSSVYVDISAIKALNIFPIWLDKLEDAISTNVHSFATFDSNMYNKKLGGMFGGVTIKSPNKNLIIIDISGSIPRSVSATCLALAKNLSENFYADLMITGSKTTLYAYEDIEDLDVTTIYDENGMDNDQIYFEKIVSGDERHYDSVIVFGDDDSPGYPWSNEFNKKSRTISSEDGKKINKWRVDKLISFHTSSSADRIAAYGDWFEPDEVEMIKEWTKDLLRS